MDMHPANAWHRMARSSGTQESSWAVTLEEKGNGPRRIDSLKVSADHAPAQDKHVGLGVWLLWISCCREECEQFLGTLSLQDISIIKGVAEMQ